MRMNWTKRERLYIWCIILYVVISLMTYILWWSKSLPIRFKLGNRTRSNNNPNVIIQHTLNDITQAAPNILKNPKWPPENIESRCYDGNNDCDLKLNPLIGTRKPVPWTQRYYHLLQSLYNGTRPEGSFAFRAYHMEQHLRITTQPLNYHFYPQLVDLRRTVTSIRNGKPVEQAPVTDPHLKIIRAPSFCTDKQLTKHNVDLIVLIKSCVRCTDKRKIARDTFMKPHLWQNFSIHFAFVTRIPPKNHTGYFHFDGISLNRPSRGNERNGKDDTYHKLLMESAQFGDLLIGDLEDYYFSLPIKLIFTYRWITAFCRHVSKLFLFLDDDFLTIPHNLIRYVKQIPQSVRPDVTVGIKYPTGMVHRFQSHGSHDPWALSYNEIPWPTFPPFLPGAAYMLGIN